MTNTITSHRIQVVRLLLNSYIIMATAATILSVLSSSLGWSNNAQSTPLFTFVSIAITVVLICLRLIPERFHRLTFIFVVISITISSLIITNQVGINNAIVAVNLVMLTVSMSIVISTRAAVIYAVLMLGSVFAIDAYNYFLGVEPELYSFGPVDYLVYLAIFIVLLYVVRMGYSEISHSYRAAINSLAKLEELNAELDKKVELRTKQLTESYRGQADSLHSAAIMGSITKSMLHDLATPISSLKGVFSLINPQEVSEDSREILASGEKALEQAGRIITNARNLMAGKTYTQRFSPWSAVEMAIFASKGMLQKDSIKTSNEISPRIMIEGYPELFERIIVNLMLNSVEELRQVHDRQRKITITGKALAQEGECRLEFVDNGRGIPKEILGEIFTVNYTTKNKAENLGFGLTFVKETIEQDFKGKISIESTPEKYTKIVLTLPLAETSAEPNV